ncbi:MAG: PQQ-binding-like beta-propeller repeat protein [Armatimonadetes bacterium]|nr:PQQ-binding-like beta-propeller repeat protein [Armatimonadota bacterium]
MKIRTAPPRLAGGDSTRSQGVSLSRAAEVLQTGTLAVDWRVGLPAPPVDVPPLVDGEGNVYLGDQSGQLHAVSPEGELRWSCPLSSPLRFPPVRGPRGEVYVAGEWAVDAIGPSGEPLWRAEAPWNLAGPPAVTGDGRVYVGTTAGEVVEFTGGKARQRGRPWKAPIALFLAPGPGTSLVAIRASGDMMLYEPRSWLLSRRRESQLPGMVQRPPTPGPAGRLFFSCMAPGMRYSLCSLDAAAPGAPLRVLARFRDFQPISPPSVGPAGLVAIAVAQEGIQVFDREGRRRPTAEGSTTGEDAWPDAFPRTAAVEGGLLVTGKSSGQAAFARGGAFELQPLGSTGLTPPAATPDGRFVVASPEGVVCLDPDPARIAARALEAPEPAAPGIRRGEEFVDVGPIRLPVRKSTRLPGG